MRLPTAILAVLLFSTSVFAQVCPRCGRIHSQSPQTAVSRPSGVENVVSLLNRQRAAYGRLRPLTFDPVLQRVAERRVALMARSGRRGHPPGSFSPGRYEGVGWSSSSNPTAVHACYTYASHVSRCGAAAIRTSRGTYFAVVYR